MRVPSFPVSSPTVPCVSVQAFNHVFFFFKLPFVSCHNTSAILFFVLFSPLYMFSIYILASLSSTISLLVVPVLIYIFFLLLFPCPNPVASPVSFICILPFYVPFFVLFFSYILINNFPFSVSLHYKPYPYIFSPPFFQFRIPPQCHSFHFAVIFCYLPSVDVTSLDILTPSTCNVSLVINAQCSYTYLNVRVDCSV